MPNPTRRPNLRQRQAELTRSEILAAARSLFASRGYDATTMKDIAKAAGASVQTVYSSVGTKSQLVRELNDLIDSEAGVGEIVRTALAATDPETVLDAASRVARALVEHCGDIIRVAAEGAAYEPDLADLVREGHRRHVAGVEAAVHRLVELGALPAAANPEALTRTISALTDVSFALVLVDLHGWTLNELETWQRDTLQTLVFG